MTLEGEDNRLGCKSVTDCWGRAQFGAPAFSGPGRSCTKLLAGPHAGDQSVCHFLCRGFGRPRFAAGLFAAISLRSISASIPVASARVARCALRLPFERTPPPRPAIISSFPSECPPWPATCPTRRRRVPHPGPGGSSPRWPPRASRRGASRPSPSSRTTAAATRYASLS